MTADAQRKDFVKFAGDDWHFDYSCTLEVGDTEGLQADAAVISLCCKRYESDPDPGLVTVTSFEPEAEPNFEVLTPSTARITIPLASTSDFPIRLIHYRIRAWNQQTGRAYTTTYGRIEVRPWPGQRPLKPIEVDLADVDFDSVSSMATSVTIEGVTVSDILGSLYELDWYADSLSDGAVTSWPSVGPRTDSLAQATAGKKPTRSATSFLGLPGVTSDTGDTLAVTLANPLVAGTRPYAFIVAKLNAIAGVGIIYKMAVSPETGDQVEIYHGTGGAGDQKINHYRDDSVGATAATSGAADTLPRLYECGFTAGGAGTHVVDGAARNSIRTGTPATNVVLIRLFADDATPTSGSSATIARVIVCNAEPSEAVKRQLRAYLRVQYGLPSTIESRTEVLDLRTVDATVDGNLLDATTYNGYVFFPPGNFALAHKKTARFNANGADYDGAFLEPGRWSFYDRTGTDANYKFFGGCCSVGQYQFLAKDSGSLIYRYDMSEASFTSPSAGSYKVKDVSTIAGIPGTPGDYFFPFSDGARYVYFPQLSFQSSNGNRMLRLDSQADPTSDAAWEWSPDTTTISALAKGMMGGTCLPDGRVLFAGHQYRNSTTGATVNGSPDVTVVSATGLVAGGVCAGTGIPAGAKIASIAGLVVTLTANATATNASVALTFDMMHGNHLLWTPANGSFGTGAAWTAFNAATVNALFRGTSDAVYCNGYVYFAHGEATQAVGDGYYLIRWLVSADFTTGWEGYDLRNVYSLLRGFTGLFAQDDRYVVLTQSESASDPFVCVFDTNGAGLTSVSSYEYGDSRRYAGGTTDVYGCLKGVAVGGYRYLANYRGNRAVRVRKP